LGQFCGPVTFRIDRVYLGCVYPSETNTRARVSQRRVYRYFDFSPQQFNEFLAAESKGGYFSRHIRDRFRCEQVRQPYNVAS
jgi:hypothetical protein